MITFKEYLLKEDSPKNDEEFSQLMDSMIADELALIAESSMSDQEKLDFEQFISNHINRGIKGKKYWLCVITYMSSIRPPLFQISNEQFTFDSYNGSNLVFKKGSERRQFPAKQNVNPGVRHFMLFPTDIDVKHFVDLVIIKYGNITTKQEILFNNGMTI